MFALLCWQLVKIVEAGYEQASLELKLLKNIEGFAGPYVYTSQL
jgi:hypothetical protein